MGGHGEKLSRKEQLAISALLTCPSYKKAATKVGVHEWTLRQWMKKSSFRAAYLDACKAVVEGVKGRLQASATLALTTLRRNLRTGNAGVEVRAAATILEHALKCGAFDDLTRELAAVKLELQELNARVPVGDQERAREGPFGSDGPASGAGG